LLASRWETEPADTPQMPSAKYLSRFSRGIRISDGVLIRGLSMPSIAHLIHVYGLLVVAVVIGLECIGIPFPGETVLIIASVIAGTKHDLNITSVILTAAAASIIGRMIGYVIGRKFGYWLLLRYGGYLWITEGRLKLGQYLFLRHGGKIILIAQFLPVLRTIAGILAGANRMPRPRFMLTNIIGAFLWATFYGLAAYSLGREVEGLAGWTVFVFGLVVLIFIFVGATFVARHEAELTAEAEQALPGPLDLH
jgi:membrane protein DedA with SNARE-associated domain